MENALQLALTFHNGIIYDVAFDVNIDQTQVVYQPGSTAIYKEVGLSKSVIGSKEKRAFTLLLGISASGDLLPFQAIYKGKTAQSTPLPNSADFAEAKALGFLFEFSATDMYWSTFDTMCSYINSILVPYWIRKKKLLGAQPDQECVLWIDCWSVHCLVAFHTWIDMTWPWIKY